MSDVVTADGTHLAVVSRGPTTGPVVVLVHGLGLSVDSWGRVPELLADTRRVVAYDLRGHGRSGNAPDGDYSLSAHARDLQAVLSRVVAGGERAVVVGHSLGGGIILTYARDVGVDQLGGVVFAGSGGSGVTAPGLPARALPSWAKKALRYGWLGLLRGTAVLGRRLRFAGSVSDRLVRRFAFSPNAPEEAVDRVREQFLSSRPRALARTTLASVSHDGVRLAPHLRVPTLVLHGTRDPEVPADEVGELMSALPDGQLVELPGAGHMLPLLHPDFVAGQVTRWMAEVGDRRRPDPR